jgi:hypothetical protein
MQQHAVGEQRDKQQRAARALMPEAADEAAMPAATGTGGTLSSMGRTAACRCERQPATARPP